MRRSVVQRYDVFFIGWVHARRQNHACAQQTVRYGCVSCSWPNTHFAQMPCTFFASGLKARHGDDHDDADENDADDADDAADEWRYCHSWKSRSHS